MAAGSELAALFEARRLKDAETDNGEPGNDVADADDPQLASSTPPPSTPGPAGSVSQPSTFGVSAFSKETSPREPTISVGKQFSTSSGRQTPLMPPTESLPDNDAEDGIPTPAFLLNARKNLKSANKSSSGGTGDIERASIVPGNPVINRIGNDASSAQKGWSSSKNNNVAPDDDVAPDDGKKENQSGKGKNQFVVSKTDEPIKGQSAEAPIDESSEKHDKNSMMLPVRANKPTVTTTGYQTPLMPPTESPPDNDAEDGVPTPAFLLNARKNLKPAKKSSGGGTGKIESAIIVPENLVKNGIGNDASSAQKGGGSSKINVAPDDGKKENQSWQGKNQFVASKTHEPIRDQSVKAVLDESSEKHDKNSIMLPVRANKPTVKTSNQSNTTQQKTDSTDLSKIPVPATSNQAQQKSTKTPSYLRRERLMAKVMSQRGKMGNSDTSNSENNGDASIDKAKIKVTSPNVDEVEMLFADANIRPENVSFDSITNEIQVARSGKDESASVESTNPINNAISQDSKNTTPEKARISQNQRLHMASTPKIRGNRQHRRDDFNQSEGGQSQPKVLLSPRSPSSQQPSSNSQPTSLHQFQLEEKTNANINNAYSLQDREPSALSQLSTPSCFPSDVPNNLQQPVLGGGGGGIISSSPSFGNNSTISAFSGVPSTPSSAVQIGIGGSAFSPGVEAENRRLRNQLGMMQRKVDEKDAIISQLMKRISDLEANNFLQNDSSAMTSLWEHSQPAFRSSGGAEAYSPFPMRTNSHDTDFSGASSHHLHPIKQSPNTTATGSTTSVTTSSSKSRDLHHSQKRSNRPSPSSASSSRRKDSFTQEIKRSPSKQRSSSKSHPKSKKSPSQSASQNGKDDRVFIC